MCVCVSQQNTLQIHAAQSSLVAGYQSHSQAFQAQIAGHGCWTPRKSSLLSLFCVSIAGTFFGSPVSNQFQDILFGKDFRLPKDTLSGHQEAPLLALDLGRVTSRLDEKHKHA